MSNSAKPTHVWLFNINRRVYGPNKSRPIWREHWERREIIGETSRSWIVRDCGRERKIPKRPTLAQSYGVAWSEADLDRLEWLQEHRYRIVCEVERLPPDALIAVARLISYSPAPPDHEATAPGDAA